MLFSCSIFLFLQAEKETGTFLKEYNQQKRDRLKKFSKIPPSKKSLGQNFLSDKNVLERMVSFVPENLTDLAIEIGTGTGALTKILSSRFERVVTIEKDDRLVAWLHENDVLPDNCRLIHHDVLKVSFSSITQAEGKQEAVVVGNLPYNVSSQIVFKLFDEHRTVPAACLLFQKEVAERITASKSKKSLGVLSLVAQLFYNVRIVMDLSPGLFRPRPKVTSSLVLFERKEKGAGVQDAKVFLRVIKAAFAQRRKKILNTMAGNLRMDKKLLGEILKEAGIDPSCRAEDLELRHFVALTNRMCRYFL